MKLSLEQIKKITKGAISIEENDGIFSFYRFSKPQYDFYREANPSFYVKAHATSGVNLDFYTDSSAFSFDFKISNGSSRKYYFFDIYVDGIMVKHCGEDDMWIMKGTVSVDLAKNALPARVKAEGYGTDIKEGERHVRVWLPNLTCAELSNVTLDDGASLRPAGSKMKMICWGDSITQGYDAKFASLSYTNRIARYFDADAVNQAIGAEKFVPQIIDPEMGFDPDVITVAYGTNDWSGYTREMFESYCADFISGIAKLYPKAKIFIILPIWRGDWNRIPKNYGGTFGEACDYIRAQAEKNGCIVVDGWNYLPQYPEFFADLRLHPNDLGFAEYAENLIAEMKKYL